jgi:2-oxoglutarate ferredoxin oxidoreductase subunit alpha
VTVLIGGEAGQGLVTVGQLLSKALVRAGWRICVTQGYQSRVRGGHNSWAIRFGAGEIGPGERRPAVALGETRRAHKIAPPPRAADATALDPLGFPAARPYAKLASISTPIAALGVADAVGLSGVDLGR